MFDIRRIKPVHGWREFVGEVGIIVVGVLIALTAEQAVEWVHWHDKVTTTRNALRAELSDNYQAAAERLIETPCLNRQLDELEARVMSSTATLTPAPIFHSAFGLSVYRHSSRPWDDTIWQSALGEQVISHFDQTERQQLAAAYNSISLIRRMNNEEDAADGQLNVLNVPIPLGSELRGHFIELIEADRQRADFMNFIAGEIIGDERAAMPELGDVLRNRDWQKALRQPITTPSYCRAHGYPLGPIPKI